MHACFAPDSRSIVVVADLGLYVSVWSLVDKSTAFVECPKMIPGKDKGSPPSFTLAFSPDGHFLAILTRKSSKVLPPLPPFPPLLPLEFLPFRAS